MRPVEIVLMDWLSIYGYIPASVFVFLIIDLLLEARSFTALLRNKFFWLYWLVYTVAAVVALYLLRKMNGSSASPMPPALLNLIAVVGTSTILQSLTLRVGGKKVLELSQYLTDYRREVLVSSSKLVRNEEKKRTLAQSRRILAKSGYKTGESASEKRIGEIYAQVMLFGSRDSARVEEELIQIKRDCEKSGADFGPEVARRIAQADPEWVRNFLAD
jgi:hypothetical protein